MTKLEEAASKFNKADRRYNIAKILFGAFLVIFFMYMAVQQYRLQSTVAQNQAINSQASRDRFEAYTKSNEAEHKKTQEIVKQSIGCIAGELLKSIDERDFSRCGVEVK